jgi:hypothetical protein
MMMEKEENVEEILVMVGIIDGLTLLIAWYVTPLFVLISIPGCLFLFPSECYIFLKALSPIQFTEFSDAML